MYYELVDAPFGRCLTVRRYKVERIETVMIDFEIESQNTREVEWPVERNKVRRRRSLLVKRNNLVERRSRRNSDMEVKADDLALEEGERQNPIGQESEGDNCEKLNLKIGCSWFVRVNSKRRMGTCMHWNAKRWTVGIQY